MDTDCVLLHLRRNTTSEVGHGLQHQLFDSTRSRGFPKKCTAKYLRAEDDYWIFFMLYLLRIGIG